ncbi:MAG: ATP synthase F1 subunit gamma [Planctomycetes bacterium]|nr:ATP synthase F1 subunit gamma [Planctomycetota bacterium]
MANLRDLRRRRKSVANTKKITRTMELVASAKLKKAQDAASASRPYADALRALVASLSAAAAGGDSAHPLMAKRAVKKVLILVATSDRGLAGAFNANLVGKAVELAKAHRAQGRTVEFVALGKKAASTLSFLGTPPSSITIGIMDAPKYPQAQKIAEATIARFIAADADLVEVVYSRFISAARQAPDALVLLPAGGDAPEGKPNANVIFHPDPATLLAALIPQTVKTALFSALLQTSAGEHAARRIAMKNASDAASDMVKSITTVYNRGRQGKITQEIAEIVGAVEAMA